jgi:hypothetical protein
MHGATGIPAGGPVTEERAGPGKLIDNTRIQKKVTLVGINTDRGFLTGVIIMYQKTKVPGILFYRVDHPKVFTAFPALKTFEGQGGSLLNGETGS